MVMPAVTVKVIAETAAAEAGLETVESKLRGVDAAARKSGAGLRGARSPMTQLGTATRNTGHHTANLTAQFNDIGVMLAAGQSPLTLAMQQGTQISQVFQTMGGGVKGSLKAVGAGIASMVSPMAILTIGTIAGGAALFQWATRASEADEAAEALAEKMEKAQQAGLALGETLRGLRLGIDENELVLADKLTEALEAQLAAQNAYRLGSVSSARALRDANAILAAAQNELDVYRDQVAEKERLSNFARDLSEQERQLGEQMADTATQSQENLNIVELMKAGITASTVQAMQLAGVDMDAPITDAANEAARLAENLGISYQAAVNLSLLNARGPASGLLGGRSAGPGGEEVVSEAAMREEFLNQLDPDRNKTKSVGGGGSDGQTPEEKRQEDLEFLIESLKTEAETVAEWHQTAMDNLDSANAQELTILGGHQEAKERLEAEHQRRLAEMQTGYQGDSLTQAATFFGDMESAMQNGSERMLKIAKIFGAAESLINSYRAYTAVLADPTLPWFARVPAAVGVMSAGLGMVSAIKGVSSGGGGGVTQGTASQPSITAAPSAEEGSPSINRSLTLIGDQGFSREQIEQIIELSNEGQDNGIILRGRR